MSAGASRIRRPRPDKTGASASAEAQPLGLCCAGGLTTSAVVNSTTMPHPPEPAMSRIERQQFRRICGKFASGITVVTVRNASGALHGMTANSFTSVSLTPPLVLVWVDRSALILEHFRSSPYFGINILSASQRLSGVNYFFALTTTISPGQRQLLLALRAARSAAARPL